MLWYKTDDEPRELVSYWTLRKAVGVLGAALPLLLVVLLLRDSALVALKPVFWLEAFALAACGVSWLTKGEMILADANSD